MCRELPAGARQSSILSELASEQRAEPQLCSRHSRSLTVTAGGYKMLYIRICVECIRIRMNKSGNA